jgi:hypothetical protein
MARGDYSAIAIEQLDSLEARPDAALYEAVLMTCEMIFRSAAAAQRRSSAITTASGIRFRLSVAGHHPYKVFWDPRGPRIVAVFPHP